MDFGFSEEQKNLGEVVGQVLADFPVLTAPDGSTAQDADVWSALAELGLFALMVPEALGGVGLTLVDVALSAEALGAGLAPPLVASTLIATDLIARFGSEPQKAEYLPRIAEGKLRISLATQEAGAGYDPADIATSVSGGKISGTKLLVAGGEQADAHLVLALVDGKPGLVLVARGASGLTLRAHDTIDPGSGFTAITLDAAPLDEMAVLASENSDAAVARLLDVAATVFSGLQTGIAARLLDTAVEYTKTREQFGQVVGGFQAIKHRCADMAVSVDAARSATYYAFWAAAEDVAERARASSMAKAYCGEVTRTVANEAVQLHGGMGFTWELPLHRFMRRAKVLDHAFGSPEWHYERVLATAQAARVGAEA